MPSPMKCPTCGKPHAGFRASSGAVSQICELCYKARLAPDPPLPDKPPKRPPTKPKSSKKGAE